MEYHPMLSLVIIYIIYLSGVLSAVIPDLSAYNPLEEEGFTVENGWQHYETPRTNMVGSAANLKNGDTCMRVITFSTQGLVLDYHRTKCDGLDPRIGLLEAFGALWYFKEVLARQEPDDKYIVYFKTQDRSCNKKTYAISDGSLQDSEKEEAVVNMESDNYCNRLLNFEEPKMKLLSSQSSLGTSKARTNWAPFNIWEPLGIVTRFYRLGSGKVFRLLVFTSYGRVILKLKVSGGPIQGLVFEDKALYYGNVAIIKAEGANMNTFTTLYNPNNGVCVKRTVTLSSNNKRTMTKPEHIEESNQECQDLINRKTAGASVSEDELAVLRKAFAEDTIDVKPFENGLSLEGKERIPTWNDINLNQNMGAVFYKYKPIEGERLNQIIVTAKGVPLAGFLKKHDTSKIVAKKDHLYFDKDIMVKKGADKNSFIVITNLFGESCSEKTYTLKSEGGKLVKEDKTEVSKTKDDQECKDLIEGNKLKNQDAKIYVSAVDETELTSLIEEDMKVVEPDPENKDL